MAETRRAFVERLVQAGFGAAAAGALAGFKGRSEDRGVMYGPVRHATEVLQRPPAIWAQELVAPYGDGRPLSNQWAVAYIAEGRQRELIFVLVDLETGGHAELDVWARDRSSSPLTGSRKYDVYSRGPAPAHLIRAAEKLAGHMGRNERRVKAPYDMPRKNVSGRTA